MHGKNHYLGPFGSSESHERYARLITKWRATRDVPASALNLVTNGEVTVNAVILQYLIFASGYYLKHGQPTGELNNIRQLWRHSRSCSEERPLSTLGPRIWSWFAMR
jgi:hypothetical protein